MQALLPSGKKLARVGLTVTAGLVSLRLLYTDGKELPDKEAAQHLIGGKVLKSEDTPLPPLMTLLSNALQ